MSDSDKKPRLIEVAFPLKQASLNSVHEKNVRHGHISTLHIWPARRPLAASRAAIIATLLRDPGEETARRQLVERIGGKLTTRVERKRKGNGTVDVVKEETLGGVLHWGTEGGPDIAWFRDEVRAANDGNAPRFLDPFAGGGAIPFEAMRLGCDVSAIDFNPVAWFLLKCSLEYPQRFAGKTLPLPPGVRLPANPPDAAQTNTGKRKAAKKSAQEEMFAAPEVGLPSHVRAWGRRILDLAKVDLKSLYPQMGDDPTVAYLWARTASCKNCRAKYPLLKTRWLSKKENKRVLLTMKVTGAKSIEFGVRVGVGVAGSNATQRREHDKKLGTGTMSATGATCPFCKTIMTMEDLRQAGQAGLLGRPVMTAVVVDGTAGKSYRSPDPKEIRAAERASDGLERIFADVPFGIPEEQTPGPAGNKTDSSALRRYGFFKWRNIFSDRQLYALGTFIRHTRAIRAELESAGYPDEWREAIAAYVSLVVDRIADRGSTICHWDNGYEKVSNTFTGYRFPMSWDYVETAVTGDSTGSYLGQLEWVALFIEHAMAATARAPKPVVHNGNAIKFDARDIDLIVTDPPYYDAIPYANLMDFFYVWLRRTIWGLTPEIDANFSLDLSPKWDHEAGEGELIDDPHRFQGDREKAKREYEEGMYRVFQRCHAALKPDGRLVIVFAHKNPDAWETLVGGIFRAGFVVDGSWPIQTEMGNRTRALSSAALSSSVWMVCRKRSDAARPGWDNRVLEEMRQNIHARLREFWDAGIRGPDFVWAATGPALEAYSRHPVVKKANEPGQTMTVGEFLRHVRRLVVDYVVGRVLTHGGEDETVSGLDDVTTYYLLHRNDFRFGDAPAGACILYAVSCGLSDRDLTETYDLLSRTGGTSGASEDDALGGDADGEEEGSEGSGSKMRLKAWDQRKRKGMGADSAGRATPLIDQTHRLMQLWKAGDVTKVDDYLDARALKKNQTFHKLLQALIELAEAGSEERAMLESISNHLAIQPAKEDRQRILFNA